MEWIIKNSLFYGFLALFLSEAVEAMDAIFNQIQGSYCQMSLSNKYTDNFFMGESSTVDVHLRLLFRAFHYEKPCSYLLCDAVIKSIGICSTQCKWG